MFRKVFPVLIVLGSSLTVFAKDVPSRTCQVHVTMSGESTLPAHLRLQVFSDSQSVLEREVPLDGTLELSGLPVGEYRLQVHAGNPSMLSAGHLHVTDQGPCREDISLAGRADSKNQFVEDDVDVEDLRVPPKARAVFQNAFMDVQRGDLNKAKHGFLEVIKLDPKLSRAYNVLGVISDQQGDKKGAREYFEKALELNPVSKSALLNLAKLSATEKQYSTSIGLFERYLAGSPEVADVHVMEADVYLKMGDFQNVIRQANKTHALPHATWAIIHALAAQAYEGLHETDQAVLEYQRYAAECSSDALRQEAAARIQALRNGSPQELPAPAASFAFH